MRFDGSSTVYSITASPANVLNNTTLTLTGNFTIELWINCAAQTQARPLLFGQNSSYTTSTNNNWYIVVSPTASQNVIVIYNTTLGSPFITGTIPVTDSVWHQVVLTRIGTTVTLYVDVVANGTFTTSATVNFSSYTMGSNTLDGALSSLQLAYNGLISDVRIYNDVGLTPAQIQQNFNALRGRFEV